MADVSSHYRIVLDDLREQRGRLIQELAEIDAAVAAILRRVPSSGPAQSLEPILTPSVAQLPPREPRPDAGVDYPKMSLRWAVLSFLSDVATSPMGTGAITTALEERGMKSKSQSKFGNLVSAVLSNLRVKGEAEVNDGQWQVTGAGRTMWAHIKTSPKFQQTMDGSNKGLLGEAE